MENEKSIIVAKEEFAEKLKSIINDSGLPIILLDMVMREFYNEIHSLYIKQYLEEKDAASEKSNN